jgi:hypothetical protein
MCWTPLCANKHKDMSCSTKTGGKDNITSFICRNRNEHHNTEHKQFCSRSFIDVLALWIGVLIVTREHGEDG